MLNKCCADTVSDNNFGTLSLRLPSISGIFIVGGRDVRTRLCVALQAVLWKGSGATLAVLYEELKRRMILPCLVIIDKGFEFDSFPWLLQWLWREVRNYHGTIRGSVPPRPSQQWSFSFADSCYRVSTSMNNVVIESFWNGTYYRFLHSFWMVPRQLESDGYQLRHPNSLDRAVWLWLAVPVVRNLLELRAHHNDTTIHTFDVESFIPIVRSHDTIF